MTPVLAAAENTPVLVTAVTAMIASVTASVLAVLNWVQRARESGAKVKAEAASDASIATQAALDGLRETYRQGVELLRSTISDQQTQISALTNTVGQLQGQLTDCRDERKVQDARIKELERRQDHELGT